MSYNMERPAWMEDELVQNIPGEKLDFLNRIFTEANVKKQNMKPGKNQSEMLRMLMPVIRQAKAANLTFSPQELQAAIAAIRKYSTKEELEQIDRIYNQHTRNMNPKM